MGGGGREGRVWGFGGLGFGGEAGGVQVGCRWGADRQGGVGVERGGRRMWRVSSLLLTPGVASVDETCSPR